MEYLIAGFVLSWISMAIGWFGHRELIHKPYKVEAEKHRQGIEEAHNTKV